MVWWLTLLLVVGLLAGLRWAVHRSLAPARVVEAGNPAAIGLPHEDVAIPTENGKFLFGWFVTAHRTPGAPAVVLLHGWGGNAETLLPLARPLHEAGFSALFIDARCHGKSDEDSFASMPRFAEDLGHAIDWLKRGDDQTPRAIAAIGHSVGAAAALLAASRRSDLAAVISIAAFSHPERMMRRWFDFRGIPYVPLGWLMLRYVQWVIGHRFDDIAPINTIRRVACPTLLIHGEDDLTVPVAEAYAIQGARSGDQVRLQVVRGSHDDFADLDKEIPALMDFLSSAVRA